ncbi:lysine--tRNA ligase [Candidatus Woesebacteria bacterium]|nr:lysine--tRNA ligase [Candidatus Woesebacteria bacterium]
MSRLDETIQAKISKRKELEEQGILPHPYSYNKTHTIAACRAALGDDVSTAGRIMSKREHGKVTFLNLKDQTATIQVMVKEEAVGVVAYKQLVTLIDSSDYLGVVGKIIETKTGELTVEASSFTVLSKALRSLPASFQGIEDKEVRFRNRYLDMLIDPQVKKVLDARWLIEKEIRRYLQDVYNFVEVETPVLQPLYGGTNAKPFSTHMNALDSDFFLRIAPELYLKRLIVGGYERVFEIARNFRNEGIDQTHQPEFTMIEWYHAYADYTVMMDVAEGLFKHLCDKLYQSQTIDVGQTQIDLSGNWPRITMTDALKQYNNIDVDQLSDDALVELLAKESIEMTGSFARGKAIFALFDHLTTKQLLNPTWIIDYPKEVSPLAKAHRSKEGFVERFELYVGTKEMADGWSEITDALDQRARFENEQKNMREGDAEAQPLDEDFIAAMEHGLPPLGGIGIGIDRLVMFLTNTWSIKEVIAFPTLRPTEEQQRISALMLHQNGPKVKKASQSRPTSGNSQSITISRDQAVGLLDQLISNQNLKSHMLAVEAAMSGLWSYFSSNRSEEVRENQQSWELVGLLHDADWEKTEETPDQHTVVLSQELEKLGVNALWADSIRTHNYEHLQGQRPPDSLMEWSLYTCDHLTGIIVACALVMPEKKIATVTAERVAKKFKEKSFAKGATREEILEGLTHLNIDLETLISIVLPAMQARADSMGL